MGFLISPSSNYQPLPLLTAEGAQDLMISGFLTSYFRKAQGDDYSFDWTYFFTRDAEDLLYRRRVLSELSELPEVVENIRALSAVLTQIRSIRDLGDGEDISGTLREFDVLRLAHERLSALSAALKQEINQGNIRSEGLMKLYEICEEKIAQDFSADYPAAWDEKAAGLPQMASLFFRFTLDDELRTESVALTSVSGGRITRSALPKSEQNVTDLHEPHEFGNPRDMMSPLKELIQTEAHNCERVFLDTLRKITGDLEELHSDLLYYLSALLYIHDMEKVDAPLCYAKVASPADKAFTVTSLYNPVLAEIKDILPVANDIDFAPGGEILILTGINQGGKTTFLRSVGLCQALFQLGWPVPAETARISPVDRIVTVFSHEEDTRLQHGKLGQELKTIRRGLDLCTADSLMLFNEPVTGTSPLENLYLSREVLVSAKISNYRGIWVTHLYDLAAEAPEMNESLPGSTVSSIIAVVNKTEDDVSASYHIRRGAPEFTSYAKEMLAKKK